MNTLVIVLIAAVCLFGAYALYGRWLANKWGIDPTAKTPAVVHEDGRDYVPTDGWTVFAHQFSSIAGAGPVTGAIQAAAFGWLPVLLWVLLGGIFFGAVTDFGALYASVKNDGKSMGMLIEKYIGKTGRKLFLLFCWLFCGIVIAAFADMVAGTFNAYGTDGALVEAAQTNGAAGMVSIMFMVFAVVFGLLQNKFHFTGWKENVISIVFIVLSFVVGANAPVILGKAAWSYITFVYIFFAAVLPMWLLKQPRDHMTTFMFVAMIVGAVLGLIVNHPVMNLRTHRVEITAQNHGFGLLFPTLGELIPEESAGETEHRDDLRFWVEKRVAPVVRNEKFGRIQLTHVNLNDGTAEGIAFLDIPAFSVQYHPEASPGPTDAHYLFTAFSRLMDGREDYLDIDIAADRLAGWKFGGEVNA